MSSGLQISSEQQRLRVPRRRIERAVRAAFRLVGRRRVPPLSIAVVGDRHIARLHREHLDVAGATDVLSFPLHDLDEALARDLLLGEVVVSADTAARVAAERGHPPTFELTLYAVHGVLHLLGYDDHRPADQRRMREAEARCLRAAGVARPLWD